MCWPSYIYLLYEYYVPLFTFVCTVTFGDHTTYNQQDTKPDICYPLYVYEMDCKSNIDYYIIWLIVPMPPCQYNIYIILYVMTM